MTRDCLILTDVRCLPSGRRIARMYNGTRFINIYARSDAERKQEKEWFYNVDVPYLKPATETDIIFAGYFNCVLSQTDATGHRNNSRALENLATGLGLSDVVEMTSSRPMFTHYSPTGASSLDRIYISRKLRRKKLCVDTLVTAFTDHVAIVMRMESSDPISVRGRGI